MNDLLNPTAIIGDNKPPLAIEVRDRNTNLFDDLDQLATVLPLVPEVITNDDDEGKAQDLHTKIRKTVKLADATYKFEKEPFDASIKALKAAFTIPVERVQKVGAEIHKRIDAYKDKKAMEERRRREEEAERQRLAAEAAAEKARQAEADRLAAERKRKEEERKAEEARLEKERQLQAAREAEARAEAARKEEARLEKERKERLEREEKERREEEKRKAADEAEQKKINEQRAAEQKRRDELAKEEQRKLDDLRAERLAEEKKAEEARQIAKEEQIKRWTADEEAKKAGGEERSAKREEKANLTDAVRLEKRADRLDDAAEASDADLSRGRGEYGSVGSLVTRWTWRMIDRDKVPLEALRAYLHPDAIDTAVTRFMQAHRPELGKGRDSGDLLLLPGVEFYQDTTTRIV
jgi:hypothetical protein